MKKDFRLFKLSLLVIENKTSSFGAYRWFFFFLEKRKIMQVFVFASSIPIKEA